MDILNMLDKIRNTQGCIVYSPCGLPSLSEGVDLPNDLKVFYENCGGVSFFTDSAYGFRIVSPEETQLSLVNFVRKIYHQGGILLVKISKTIILLLIWQKKD